MPLDPDSLNRLKSNDPTLSEVSFSISNDQENKALIRALTYNTQLQKLILKYSDYSSARRLDELVSAVSITQISSLCISNCSIKSGVKCLIKVSSTLTTLDLRNNELGDEGITELSSALSQGSCSFKTLVLGNTLITNDGAATLGEALGKGTPSLEELDIRENQIGDDGVKALASILIRIKTVDLRENHIGDKGATTIGKVMYSYEARIQDLHLSDNQIGNSGAESLAKALTKNVQLRKLTLYENLLTDAGALSFLDALEYNDTLHHLDLSRNAISDKKLRQDIVKILEGNRNRTRTKKAFVPGKSDSASCSGIVASLLAATIGDAKDMLCGTDPLHQ
jgi:Ran GTPase-activating protein (RanGAP) involved in mRNA processing and transport